MKNKFLAINENTKLIYWKIDNKSDKTCFFLHGLGDSKESFENLVRTLKLRKINIIVYDLPGFGENNDVNVPFENNFDLLKEIIDNEEGQYKYFIGHSMGGLILLLTIIKYDIHYEEIITIEPSLTNSDYEYFSSLFAIIKNIGVNEYLKSYKITNYYSDKYYKNLQKSNISVFENYVRTIYNNFNEYQNIILKSKVKYFYLYGNESKDIYNKKIFERSENVKIFKYNNAGHWVHVDAESKVEKFIEKCFKL